MTTLKITSQTSPAALLGQIQALCRELGLFGRSVKVSHQGGQYAVRCDAEAFTVYRLVEQCHLPPGSPGWPVCLVTAEAILDETSPPQPPAADEFASGLTLPEWLQLLEDTFRR